MSSFWVGVVLFALAIGLSIALHEFGHFATAKAFGMRVTEFFVGFGPRLWSTVRGETEYGLKAVPAGGYVRIAGMTPQEELPVEDSDKAFYRYPPWQKAVVMVAGSAMHFLIAFVLLVVAGLTVGLPARAAVIGQVADCVTPDWTLDADGVLRECVPGVDPTAPAKVAGLQAGDVVLAVGAEETTSYLDLVETVRAAGPGPVVISYQRDREPAQVRVDLVAAQRPPLDPEVDWTDPDVTTETVGTLGVLPAATQTYGLVGAVGAATALMRDVVVGTVEAIATFPAKVALLVEAVSGQERSPESPISVVGASRVGGQALEAGSGLGFLLLLAALNVFLGMFNLLPLPPLDGGHLFLIIVDKVRSWLARARGRAEPDPVDVARLVPLTLVVIVFMGGVTILAVLADVINPIANPFQ